MALTGRAKSKARRETVKARRASGGGGSSSSRNRVAAYTTTAGQKVVKYSDGTKTYDGVSQTVDGANKGKRLKSFDYSNQGASGYTGGGGTGAPKQPVGVVSSQQGQEAFEDIMKRAQDRFVIPTTPGLTGAEQTAEEEAQLKRFGKTRDEVTFQPHGDLSQKQEQTQPQVTQTYIDPKTEATQTIQGTAEEVAARGLELQNQGFTLAEGTENVQRQQTPEEREYEKTIASFQQEIDSMKEQLESSLISDKELRSQKDAISKIWDARIRQVQDINMREEASLSTQLMRAGGRFVAGTTQGIISAAERAGVLAIGQLEGQKQSALLEAENAARNYNYDVYVELMDRAEEAQEKKISALGDLRAAIQAQEDAIANTRRRVELEATVSSNVMNGVTDPNQLFDLLNRDAEGNLVGTYSLDEIQAAIKVAQPDMDALEGLDQDYRTFAYLQSIGDPTVDGLTYDQYLRMIGNAKRAPTTGGSGGGTAEERKMNAIGQLSTFMAPGAVFPTGNPVLGDNGYIGADGWRYFVQKAQQMGINKEDFIQNFSHLINPDHQNPADLANYALSPADIQMAMGFSAGNFGYKDDGG